MSFYRKRGFSVEQVWGDAVGAATSKQADDDDEYDIAARGLISGSIPLPTTKTYTTRVTVPSDDGKSDSDRTNDYFQLMSKLTKEREANAKDPKFMKKPKFVNDMAHNAIIGSHIDRSEPKYLK